MLSKCVKKYPPKCIEKCIWKQKTKEKDKGVDYPHARPRPRQSKLETSPLIIPTNQYHYRRLIMLKNQFFLKFIIKKVKFFNFILIKNKKKK